MITKRLVRAILEQYRLPTSGIHGISHWARVLENGRELAQKTGADIEVVEFFALFHDSCRENEHRDDGHGVRGAELALTMRGEFFDLSDSAFDLLLFACRHHTDGTVEGDITVRTCWDSDRLDLGRVSVAPDPSMLCTQAARGPDMIAWAEARSRCFYTPPLVKEEWGLAYRGVAPGAIGV